MTVTWIGMEINLARLIAVTVPLNPPPMIAILFIAPLKLQRPPRVCQLHLFFASGPLCAKTGGVMQKTALLFAGQGAQYVGMGRDLASQAGVWFERARQSLGFDLPNLCFNGPESDLTRTNNAQPGIFVTSWAAFQLLKERVPNLEFHATAGLSLGELTALTAAGVFSFEDGLKISRQRGRFMQEACEATSGSMAAVLGLDAQSLQAVCAEADVEMANLNCPGQIVISGEKEKIAKACELATAKGAKRAVPLPVAGAYHSRLMAGARSKVQALLEQIPMHPPQVTVISNVTARPHGTPEEIRSRLVEQVVSPVRWEDSIRYLLDQGFRRFVELGPGTTLGGFLKRIDKSAQSLNVADLPSLDATVKALATNP
jgi:[acyl-carrier-protein] S-malonyltransferase